MNALDFWQHGPFSPGTILNGRLWVEYYILLWEKQKAEPGELAPVDGGAPGGELQLREVRL